MLKYILNYNSSVETNTADADFTIKNVTIFEKYSTPDHVKPKQIKYFDIGNVKHGSVIIVMLLKRMKKLRQPWTVIKQMMTVCLHKTDYRF